MAKINADLGKPAGTTLHWAENIKDHAQRKMVARTLGELPITITNVVVMKRHVNSTNTRLDDHASMYNYAVRRLLERLSWFLQREQGEAVLTFAHVRRFPYETLEKYIRILRAQPTAIRWHQFTGRPRIDQPTRVPGLQAADLTAGCLASALRPDQFGDYELEYLRSIYKRYFIGANGGIQSYGVNIIGARDCMRLTYPWWDRFERSCAQLPR